MSPLHSLREVADQLSLSRAEAIQMVVTGELHALVFTGADALVTQTAVTEFVEARWVDPEGDW